jgi:hypothetical protein
VGIMGWPNNPDGPSKEAPMHSAPQIFRQVAEEFAPAFTRPTLTRFLFLLFAANLTLGQRTATNVLRTQQHAAPGHPTSYHRVFSCRRWPVRTSRRTLLHNSMSVTTPGCLVVG